MFVGFIPPTNGTATINNCDLRTNLEGVRKILGLCPQHNILFDNLTVEEHLELYAKVEQFSFNYAYILLLAYINMYLASGQEIKNEFNHIIKILY